MSDIVWRLRHKNLRDLDEAAHIALRYKNEVLCGLLREAHVKMIENNLWCNLRYRVGKAISVEKTGYSKQMIEIEALRAENARLREAGAHLVQQTIAEQQAEITRGRAENDRLRKKIRLLEDRAIRLDARSSY